MSKKPTRDDLERALGVYNQCAAPFPTVAQATASYLQTVSWARMLWRNKRTRRRNAQYPAFIVSRVAVAAIMVRYARLNAESDQ